MGLSTSSHFRPNPSTIKNHNVCTEYSVNMSLNYTTRSIPHPIPSSLGSTTMLRAEDVVNESLPNLPCHTLNFLNGLLQPAGYLCSHTLKVNMVALSHVGHGGRSVDMCAIGSDGMDSRLHDLLNQSKALKSSSGQKYRLFSLGSSSLCCCRRSSRQNNGYTDLSGCGLRIWVEVRHVHEVNGGAVIDGLQTPACVEVTHSIASLVSPSCGLGRRQLWAERAEGGLV